MHQIILTPRGRGAYDARLLDGTLLASKTGNPEFQACRAMVALGLTGPATFYHGSVDHPGTHVADVGIAAWYTVTEPDRGALRIIPYVPFNRDAVFSS